MKNMFNKMILAVLTVALVFAAFPVTSAYAQDENPPKGELTNERLEKIWARELQAYERLGKAFSDIDGTVAKFQARIDKAAGNGKDVTALQTALDAFEAALTSAKPKYESMNGLVNSHQGFDTNGKVTDAERARSTVKEMGDKLKEVKDAMDGTGKALREAVKALREANKPAQLPAKRDS
jgi:predicted  nucleic acid-binding Zn-ribbon protein